VKPINHHWQYLCSLASDVENASRYVEISPDNFETFSIEFTRILLAIGSEVDVVAKVLSGEIDPSGKHKNIGDYRTTITEKYPNLHTMKILIVLYELILTPWDKWKINKNSQWWEGYTNVKHHRHTHFKDANLKNTLNALAGLFVLVYYWRRFYGDVGQLDKLPWPGLLGIPDRLVGGTVWVDYYNYTTPDG
jgi:hypothetical protein